MLPKTPKTNEKSANPEKTLDLNKESSVSEKSTKTIKNKKGNSNERIMNRTPSSSGVFERLILERNKAKKTVQPPEKLRYNNTETSRRLEQDELVCPS